MNIFKWLFSKKYRVFTKKISDVQVSIWEYDFKVAKSRQVREGIRQDRDRCVEALQRIEAQLKGEKDEQKKKELAEQQVGIADTQKRYEAQMKMIDEEINGIPATPMTSENPEGHPGKTGILEVISTLAQLREMYKEFRSKI